MFGAAAFDSLSKHELASLFVDVSLQHSLLEFAPDDRESSRSISQMRHFLDDLISYTRGDSEFAKAAMEIMSLEACANQMRESSRPESESLYRAFDRMDEILGIQYALDVGMTTELAQTERLYEGAGIGVQTSYSTILLALNKAHPRPGATVLDLGSGYGRVGFVIGYLRPDIEFIGYEYVDHRVQNSKAVATGAGFSRVEFFTQDLSARDFKIPEADVYYMYDPFSRDTYGYVLDQLLELGDLSPITIITKGRANTWVEDAVRHRGWLIDASCDDGLLLLFRSPVFQNETIPASQTSSSAT